MPGTYPPYGSAHSPITWALSLVRPKTKGPTHEARGLRNNNPGNLDRGPVAWVGEVQGLPIPGTANARFYDARFCQFDTMAHGARAMAIDLLTHYRRGANTIGRLVAIWAPPTENNTGAYIAAVSHAMNWDASWPLGIGRQDILTRLCCAIADHENGLPAPSYGARLGQDIALGVAMALKDAHAT